MRYNFFITIAPVLI